MYIIRTQLASSLAQTIDRTSLCISNIAFVLKTLCALQLHGFLGSVKQSRLQVMSHGAQSAGEIHGAPPIQAASSPITISSMSDDSPRRAATPTEASVMRDLHAQVCPNSPMEIGARPVLRQSRSK